MRSTSVTFFLLLAGLQTGCWCQSGLPRQRPVPPAGEAYVGSWINAEGVHCVHIHAAGTGSTSCADRDGPYDERVFFDEDGRGSFELATETHFLFGCSPHLQKDRFEVVKPVATRRGHACFTDARSLAERGGMFCRQEPLPSEAAWLVGVWKGEDVTLRITLRGWGEVTRGTSTNNGIVRLSSDQLELSFGDRAHRVWPVSVDADARSVTLDGVKLEQVATRWSVPWRSSAAEYAEQKRRKVRRRSRVGAPKAPR